MNSCHIGNPEGDFCHFERLSAIFTLNIELVSYGWMRPSCSFIDFINFGHELSRVSFGCRIITICGEKNLQQKKLAKLKLILVWFSSVQFIGFSLYIYILKYWWTLFCCSINVE